MNKSSYFFLTTLFSLLFIQLNAQQFFFSPEKPANCNAADGILSIVPMRGVPPFSYAWNTGSTALSLSNLPKGTYTATLTDATGATVSNTFFLNSQELDLKLASFRPSGGCNPNSGALNIQVIGGLAPYTYLWSTGMTDAAIEGLATGLYTVTIQDANGCTASGEFEVQTLPWAYFPDAELSVADQPDCANQNNGGLEAKLLYSSYEPYTYQWSNGNTAQTISNLSKGLYSVTITDALGCSDIASVFLENKLDINANVICSGNTDGSASAQLINAAAPISYVWSTGQSGPNLNGLSSGVYTVTATDAQGCAAIAQADVAAPTLELYDYSMDCYTGNRGIAFCYVNSDQPLSYLWDNGETTAYVDNMSPGNHSITVTTALGCTLTGSVNIGAPSQPEFDIIATTSPADCANNLGGALNLNINNGLSPYQLDVFGTNGSWHALNNTTLQNLQAGDYYVSVSSLFAKCYGSAVIHIADAGGFNPALAVTELDCNVGFGAAAVINANAPGVQYVWNTASTEEAIFNLTQGCYDVTVSGEGSCLTYLSFCLSKNDSLPFDPCGANISGKLINDLGASGCTGTTGIPYQLIRTMPSGAINFTDEFGLYSILLPNGNFDLDAVQYSAGDIVCPAGGQYSVNAAIGQSIADLDFHFLNNNATDLRIRQKPLRMAQPGYPYSLRLEVCNDGNAAIPGTIDLEYGNLLGSLTNRQFAQHSGAILFDSENTGSPDNLAAFHFPGLAAGACELLQLDLDIPVATPVGKEFITDARVNPGIGDPTPANNISSLYNTVAGSFDPNSVLAYPARNGNPKDGGDIIRFEDKTIIYQIFFQNTGNAPADLVVVRDLLDQNLDLSTIRNISASHNMKVLIGSDNQELVFKFENINLPDSTSDYAGSIGSIQYEIDLKSGLPVGADVKKQVSIFFDFNSPVRTNENVLEIVGSSKTPQVNFDNKLELIPNPTDTYVGFYCFEPSTVRLYNAMGALLSSSVFESGLQQLNTTDLPVGVYMVQMETNGKLRSGKLVVSR